MSTPLDHQEGTKICLGCQSSRQGHPELEGRQGVMLTDCERCRVRGKVGFSEAAQKTIRENLSDYWLAECAHFRMTLFLIISLPLSLLLFARATTGSVKAHMEVKLVLIMGVLVVLNLVLLVRHIKKRR